CLRGSAQTPLRRGLLLLGVPVASDDRVPVAGSLGDDRQACPRFGRSSRKNESSSSLEAAFANPSNLPCSAIVPAARMNAPHAVRASAPPTLTRLTPSAAMSWRVRSLAQPISRLRGFGATAATKA